MDPSLEALNRRVDELEAKLKALGRFAPPVAVQRMRRVRLGIELLGIGLVAAGLWLIFPPATLLFCGTWLMVDVVVSRRHEGVKER